jgi:uncharacterized coiled-coil protein SlyX
MKIFYKKDFYGVLEQKRILEKEFSDYKEQSDESISALNTKCVEQLKEINTLNNQLFDKEEILKSKKDLEIKLKSANTSKGGLTKEINKLRNQIKVLTNQVKEKDILLSKRYILRTIKPGRTPNTIKTSIKSSANESRAIKYVKENL